MRCAAKVILTLTVALGGCNNDDGSGEGGEAGTETETGATGTSSGGAVSSSGADQTGTGGSSGGETGEDLGPWDSLEERPCPEDNFLTYENFGGPFMLTYCTGCHSSRLPADMRQMAPLEVNFDDLEAVRAQADRVWVRAADDNDTMPPVGAGDEDERAMLGEWLACGAPTEADLDGS